MKIRVNGIFGAASTNCIFLNTDAELTEETCNKLLNEAATSLVKVNSKIPDEILDKRVEYPALNGAIKFVETNCKSTNIHTIEQVFAMRVAIITFGWRNGCLPSSPFVMKSWDIEPPEDVVPEMPTVKADDAFRKIEI